MVDAMIRLFESTATNFLSNGLGNLPDASRCEVVEERNGSYELEMEYHISGKRYSELELRRIIVAKPNPYAGAQPFRIYNISKPFNGLVTVKAEHISYDLSGYPVKPFTASDAATALSSLKSNAIVDCPFELSTSWDCSGQMTVSKPDSMRSLLGGSSGSILDVYGGEYEFDGYHVTLHANRGENRGVTIRYGKNMTDLNQEENCSNVYSAVYPYFLFEDSETDRSILIELPEKTIATPGTYNYTRIYPLDLSSEWENTYEWEDKYPSWDEIRELVKKYISDNELGTPKVSLTVSFEQLSQSNEYDTLQLLETVRLCDTVNVEFPKLKVRATSKCIKTTYNVLTGKYSSIELGESKSDLASTIVSNNEVVAEKLDHRPTGAFMKQAVEKATLSISGGLGGYVVIHKSNEEKHPDEILIMDTDNIATAQKVWRWNKGGLGYSANGYDGPYATAITQEGEIVADFVKTGHLTANIIQGGTLTVGGVDNTDGTIEVRNGEGELLLKLSTEGIEFYGEGGKNVTKIVDNTLETTNVTAKNLKVAAANITGTLTANIIQGGTLTVGGVDNTDGTMEVRNGEGELLLKLSTEGIEFYGEGGENVTKIVDDTLETTNVTAKNLKVAAANITGTLTANKIDAKGLIAETFKYSDEDYECTLADGFLIHNKSENAATSYAINGVQGSAVLRHDCLDFYMGTNFNGTCGSLWHDSTGFHFSRAIDIGTASIRAGDDGNATIVDCTSSGKFYYGASKDYIDDSSFSALRGKTVRIYSHNSGAVYLGSSGSTAVTSDENLKNMEQLDQRYEEFFMKLRPVLYTYKNNGHRKHIGYGARAVEKALKDAGLTTEDFAGLLIDRDVTIGADEMGTKEDVCFEELYSLRYEEFGALYAHMLQQAFKRIEGLESEVRELKGVDGRKDVIVS